MPGISFNNICDQLNEDKYRTYLERDVITFGYMIYWRIGDGRI
jgi:hypothetical protein